MAEEYKQTFTLTFGDVAENHAKMKKHGVMADKGYDKQDLVTIRAWFRNKGATTRLVKLHNYLPADTSQEIKDNNKAYVLIIKNGVNVIKWDQAEIAKFKELMTPVYDKYTTYFADNLVNRIKNA